MLLRSPTRLSHMGSQVQVATACVHLQHALVAMVQHLAFVCVPRHRADTEKRECKASAHTCSAASPHSCSPRPAPCAIPAPPTTTPAKLPAASHAHFAPNPAQRATREKSASVGSLRARDTHLRPGPTPSLLENAAARGPDPRQRFAVSCHG